MRHVRVRGRARRRVAARLALAAIIPLVTGCGLLGGLNTSRLGSPQSLTVNSPAFSADVPLPTQYTCHGAGLSPPLYWSGALSRSPRSYAIVVDDHQAPITPYVYWIVFDISPNTTSIGQNQLPTGARQAMNSVDKAAYDPPCPAGNGHQYRFTVYALNSMINLPNGAALRAAWSAIASHVIASGRLTVTAYPPRRPVVKQLH